MVGDFLKYVGEQMRVIADAWLVFGAAALVICAAAWKFASWWHGGVNAGAIASKDALIALYKQKLDGATPEEAREKIQALEEIIRQTVGPRWRPLAPVEIAKLSDELRKIAARRVQVMYINRYGKELARSIADAFDAASGWDVHFSMGGGFEDGIFVGRAPLASIALKEAIETATPLKAEIMSNKDDPEGTAFGLFVAVGVNPN